MNFIILLVILMIMGGFVLWFAQTYRLLVFAQKQAGEAWNELHRELISRREMVPYIVAAVQVNSEQIVEVIGNACDLAANVEGIRECAQAEARLTAAIDRLFALLDSLPSSKVNESLGRLRQGLQEQQERIALLIGAYNRRAETFNTLLNQGPARVFAYVTLFKGAVLFM